MAEIKKLMPYFTVDSGIIDVWWLLNDISSAYKCVFKEWILYQFLVITGS